MPAVYGEEGDNVKSLKINLVDDYSGNLTEWENCGGISIRFSKELESKGFLVINRLDELINMEFEGEEE